MSQSKPVQFHLVDGSCTAQDANRFQGARAVTEIKFSDVAGSHSETFYVTETPEEVSALIGKATESALDRAKYASIPEDPASEVNPLGDRFGRR